MLKVKNIKRCFLSQFNFQSVISFLKKNSGLLTKLDKNSRLLLLFKIILCAIIQIVNISLLAAEERNIILH